MVERLNTRTPSSSPPNLAAAPMTHTAGFLTLAATARGVSGGFNVYPSEVEQVIWSHPAVLDCAVIGVPDEQGVAEAPGFSSTTALTASPQSEELIAICKEKLGSVRAPKSVDFIDALPRSQHIPRASDR
jgi:hypothetical protein